MVLPFLTMPDDVLAHFARQLSDATTAGRLAQTSRAGDQLMRKPIGCQSYERNVRHQLRQLLRPRLQSEGHGAKLCTTALKHQRTVSTTAALLVTSRGARHVCGTTLRIRGAGKASKLSNHLQCCHPREYGALITAFESVHVACTVDTHRATLQRDQGGGGEYS